MERDQEAGGGVKIDYEGLKEIFKTVDYCTITSYMKTLPTFILAIALACCTRMLQKGGGLYYLKCLRKMSKNVWLSRLRHFPNFTNRQYKALYTRLEGCFDLSLF